MILKIGLVAVVAGYVACSVWVRRARRHPDDDPDSPITWRKAIDYTRALAKARLAKWLAVLLVSLLAVLVGPIGITHEPILKQTATAFFGGVMLKLSVEQWRKVDISESGTEVEYR